MTQGLQRDRRVLRLFAVSHSRVILGEDVDDGVRIQQQSEDIPTPETINGNYSVSMAV